ncbi:hypothetical protein M33023_06770 [Candidatus Phytoplasma asteris]|uniref:Uncharacterized protein n=1 Tax=Candidatus Phytoplasma asteris TaxID=85620 RepID=A0ABZ2YH76_9MOLU
MSICTGFILCSFTNFLEALEKYSFYIMAKIIILVIFIPFLSSFLLVGSSTYLYINNARPKLAIKPQKEKTKFNFANIKLFFFAIFFL